MQVLIATGSPFLHFNVVTQLKRTADILNAKKGEKNKELNWVAPFSISLVSLLLHSPYIFFSVFFPDEFYDIFLPSPLHLPPLSLLSLTPRQFSPDRFHSVLEGMDLIALWGLVGCAGLGCLISVPCRDWFNASWSWNCLIVQLSGDSLCLRRPAGLAKHCSRLLLYVAVGRVCLRNHSLVLVGGGGGRGSTWHDKPGGDPCEADKRSPEFLTAWGSVQTSQECFISAWCYMEMILLTINAVPIFILWYSVSL